MDFFFFFQIRYNPDLSCWNLAPLSSSIIADVAEKQHWMLFPLSGSAALDLPCPFICVITSHRTEIRHTVRVTPFIVPEK